MALHKNEKIFNKQGKPKEKKESKKAIETVHTYKKYCERLCRQIIEKVPLNMIKVSDFLDEIEAILKNIPKNSDEFLMLNVSYNIVINNMIDHELLSGKQLKKFALRYMNSMNLQETIAENMKILSDSEEASKKDIAKEDILNIRKTLIYLYKHLQSDPSKERVFEKLKKEIEKLVAIISPAYGEIFFEKFDRDQSERKKPEVKMLLKKPEDQSVVIDPKEQLALLDKQVDEIKNNVTDIYDKLKLLKKCQTQLVLLPESNEVRRLQIRVQLMIASLSGAHSGASAGFLATPCVSEKEIAYLELCCPLSGRFLEAERVGGAEGSLQPPVTLSSGYTFTRRKLVAWGVFESKRCPITNKPLDVDEKGIVLMFPNYTIQGMAEAVVLGGVPKIWECPVELCSESPHLVSSGQTYSLQGLATLAEEDPVTRVSLFCRIKKPDKNKKPVAFPDLQLASLLKKSLDKNSGVMFQPMS